MLGRDSAFVCIVVIVVCVPILALTQLYLVGCGKESKDVACLGSSFVSLASRGVKREREGTNLLCEGMMTEIVYGLCGWGRGGI